MKNTFFFLVAALALVSCGPSTPAEKTDEFTSYGAAFDSTGAIPIADLLASMADKDSLNAVVKCTIMQTCTKAGCWMDVENPTGGEAITVFMKDHAFGVPLSECSGLNAIVNGKAYYDTLSVDYLRHLAEDAGKPAEEIALITEPRAVLALEASGVMIKGYKGTAPTGEHDHEGHDHEGHDHSHEGEEGHSH
jgi:hypothetical protein